MKESLEAARNIHQILIIVCVAIAIFSYSLTENENKFQVALDELKSLEELLNDVEFDFRKKPLIADSVAKANIKDFSEADSLLQKIKKSNIEIIKGYLNSSWNDANSRLPDRYMLGKYVTQHHKYDQLINNARYGNSSLPKLSNVWEFVRDENIETAKKRLNEEVMEFSKKPENDLDIAGFHVTGKNIYLIAPFITIAILIYLSTLVNHIQSLLYNDKENEAENIRCIRYFPWMALFPTFKSHMLNVVTFAIFPSATCYAILARSPLPKLETNCWFVAYIILSTIFSAQIFMKALHIQDKVHYNGEFFAEKKTSTKTVEPDQPEKG